MSPVLICGITLAAIAIVAAIILFWMQLRTMYGAEWNQPPVDEES